MADVSLVDPAVAGKSARAIAETMHRPTRLCFILGSGFVVLAAVLAPAAEPGPAGVDRSKLLVYRGRDGIDHPIRTPADWANRRAQTLAAMQEVMGPLPGREKLVPPDPTVDDET